MTLEEVLTSLTTGCGDASQAKVVVLSRSVNPSTGARRECSVIDVSFDESDREIHLLLNRPPWDQQISTPLTVKSFVAKLRELPPCCNTFHFFSATWTGLDEEHVGRIDWPFDGVASNEDGSCVAFVERVL